MLSGPCLVFSLKLLILAGFHHTVFTTAVSQAACALVALALVRVLRIAPLTVRFSWADWAMTFVPIGLCVCVALATGNAVYRYMNISFIEMLKGFSPAAVLLTHTLSGKPPPSRTHVVVVSCIGIGSCIATLGEVHLHVVGLLLYAVSIFSDALRLVAVNGLLSNIKLGVVESVYHVASASSILLFVLSGLIEKPHRHWRSWFLDKARDPNPNANSWSVLFLTVCSCSILLNMASFLVIQRTDIVMLKLLAISRNALVVVCGVTVFGEETSPLQMCGYAILLSSFIYYNWLQVQQASSSVR
jgi:drug/metabolite transporter (DMT)-like permease